MTLTKKQLTDALGILISKVDRINERTKKHTIEIKALEMKLKKSLKGGVKHGN